MESGGDLRGVPARIRIFSRRLRLGARSGSYLMNRRAGHKTRVAASRKFLGKPDRGWGGAGLGRGEVGVIAL